MKANKIKKSVRFDPAILEDIENFCSTENVNFSQAVNMIAAAYFAQQKNSSKNYLSLMADYLNSQVASEPKNL